VRRWDLATGAAIVVRREPGAVEFVRYSTDGKLVLTGGGHRVWIWDPGVPQIPGDPAGFAAWLARVTTAEIDGHDRLASP
jgi:hypothetical protein